MPSPTTVWQHFCASGCLSRFKLYFSRNPRMLVKITQGGLVDQISLYFSTEEKKQKAQFAKTQQSSSPNRGNQGETRAGGAAANQRRVNPRSEIDKTRTCNYTQIEGTVMHQRFTPSGNNSSRGRSFIAAELMSDDEVQVCSSAPRVTTQLLAGGMDGWMDG